MFDDLNEKNKGDQTSGAGNSNQAFNNVPPNIPTEKTTPSPVQGTPNLNGFQSTQTAPAQKAEDMFSEVETGSGFNATEKPDAFKPKEPEMETQTEEFGEEDGHKAQKVFVLIAIILGVALIAVGGLWAFKYYTANNVANTDADVEEPVVETIKKEETPAVKKIEVEESKEEEVVPVETEGEQPEEALTQDAVDTDQDGLSDEEENILGTKIDDTDSDDDGLFDREEVEVYDTDPLNPDTDGDGYTDGAEVGNNYNPNGDGKLYEIN